MSKCLLKLLNKTVQQMWLFILFGFFWREASCSGYYSLSTYSGTKPTFTGDSGPATDAWITNPVGLWGDTLSNVFIVDFSGNRIRKISNSFAVYYISTIVGNGVLGISTDDSPATSTSLTKPTSIWGDSNGNLYYSEKNNANRVRKFTFSTGIVTTIAGGGIVSTSGTPASAASLFNPSGIYGDTVGNLYLADTGNYMIKRVELAGTKLIYYFAGNSVGLLTYSIAATSYRLDNPADIWGNTAGDMYVSNTNNYVIVKIPSNDVYTGIPNLVSLYAGTSLNYATGDNIKATSAAIATPINLWGDSTNLYFTANNAGVRYVTFSNNIVQTVFGSYTVLTGQQMYVEGFSGDGGFSNAAKIATNAGDIFSTSSGIIYMSDSGNSRVRVRNTGGIITTFAGKSLTYGGDSGPALSAVFNNLQSITYVTAGGQILVADHDNNRIRFVDANQGNVYTYIGSGVNAQSSTGTKGTATSLNNPQVVWSATGQVTYFAEESSHNIRKVDGTNIVTNVVGTSSSGYSDDGTRATSASISRCSGVVVHPSWGTIYFSDYTNSVIRYISISGILTTYAGLPFTESAFNDNVPATSAILSLPMGLWRDTMNNLYFCDTGNIRVRKIGFAFNIVSTIAGDGTNSGSLPPSGRATSILLINPASIWGDSENLIHLPQKDHSFIRTIDVSTGIMYTSIGRVTAVGNVDGEIGTASLNYPVGVTGDSNGNFYLCEALGSTVRKVSLLMYPTSSPSRQPSGQPSRQPVSRPSRQPSSQPSTQPSVQPIMRPSTQPSRQPTTQPSRQPTTQPSVQPSAQPNVRPSGQPSRQPTTQPSRLPSTQPSRQPSAQPQVCPSSQPSRQPSGRPSSQPTRQPSRQPTLQPSAQPSAQPNMIPSSQPSQQPRSQPSSQPIARPSRQPSSQPTRRPSSQPTAQPSSQPLMRPVVHPSTQPSGQPTSQPSSQPNSHPTKHPSTQPSISPTMQPSIQPSRQPLRRPTGQPTHVPSGQPSEQPSQQPYSRPSTHPTEQPSSKPSSQPSASPSVQPSLQPLSHPSSQPTSQPSRQPSSQPQTCPTSQPSSQPQRRPTGQPSGRPTQQPSSAPSDQPVGGPSCQPTSEPSCIPSIQPSEIPTSRPSSRPSSLPSIYPSNQPSSQPTSSPTNQPSLSPSTKPSILPTSQPSLQPSVQPASTPTVTPSVEPSVQPSSAPTSQPSLSPTGNPSKQPVVAPTTQPVGAPSCQPVIAPSSRPSEQPTCTPTSSPSTQPSSQPSVQPSSIPTSQPTQPTSQPSSQPSEQPITRPSAQPSRQPQGRPSRVPSVQPSSQPSSVPTWLTRGNLPSSRTISVTGVNGTAIKIVQPFMYTASVEGYGHFEVYIDPNPEYGVNYVVYGGNSSGLISLQDMSDSQGYSFAPVIQYDFTGRSVSNAGDINGDGYDDLIIGVPYAARVCVLFGKRRGFEDLHLGFTIFGVESSDLTGWAVDSAGDVNGDGFGDIVIGAPQASHDDIVNTGAAYVVYGKPHSFVNIQLRTMSNQDGFAIHGSVTNEYCGMSVSGLNDVNGDGIGDLAVASLLMNAFYSGAVSVIYGRRNRTSDVVTDALLAVDGVVLVGDSWSWTGFSLSGAGDVNHDGVSDILIGSVPQKGEEFSEQVTYVVFGNKTTTQSERQLLSGLYADQGMMLVGGGMYVATAGDMNKDGFSDVLIGTEYGLEGGGGFVIQTDLTYQRTTSPTSTPSSPRPSSNPSSRPSGLPTQTPSVQPSAEPTSPTPPPTAGETGPSSVPTMQPSTPTFSPSCKPTAPTLTPTVAPSNKPTSQPTLRPSRAPSVKPSLAPSKAPTRKPSYVITIVPTVPPFVKKTKTPSHPPTQAGSIKPSVAATFYPSRRKTPLPTMAPVVRVHPPLNYTTKVLVNTTHAYSRHVGVNIYFIINASHAEVVNSGGHDKFTIFPRSNSYLHIHYFDYLHDVIDLLAFTDITSMSQLNITRGSVLINLPHNQTIRLRNVSPENMTAENFLFHPVTHSPQDNFHINEQVRVLISIAASFAVIFFVLHQLKKLYEWSRIDFSINDLRFHKLNEQTKITLSDKDMHLIAKEVKHILRSHSSDQKHSKNSSSIQDSEEKSQSETTTDHDHNRELNKSEGSVSVESTPLKSILKSSKSHSSNSKPRSQSADQDVTAGAGDQPITPRSRFVSFHSIDSLPEEESEHGDTNHQSPSDPLNTTERVHASATAVSTPHAAGRVRISSSISMFSISSCESEITASVVKQTTNNNSGINTFTDLTLDQSSSLTRIETDQPEQRMSLIRNMFASSPVSLLSGRSRVSSYDSVTSDCFGSLSGSEEEDDKGNDSEKDNDMGSVNTSDDDGSDTNGPEKILSLMAQSNVIGKLDGNEADSFRPDEEHENDTCDENDDDVDSVLESASDSGDDDSSCDSSNDSN